MKKVWKILLPLVIIIGSFASYGALYYNAVNQIDVSIDDAEITDFTLDIIPPFSADIDLKLTGKISNPTFMNIKVQAVYFDLYLEGYFMGTGEVDGFIASDIPFPLDITLELVNLQNEVCTEVRDLILLGNSKELRMDITKIVVMNIELTINQSITQGITQEDVMII
jgi:hypothetical protein